MVALLCYLTYVEYYKERGEEIFTEAIRIKDSIGENRFEAKWEIHIENLEESLIGIKKEELEDVKFNFFDQYEHFDYDKNEKFNVLLKNLNNFYSTLNKSFLYNVLVNKEGSPYSNAKERGAEIITPEFFNVLQAV